MCVAFSTCFHNTILAFLVQEKKMCNTSVPATSLLIHLHGQTGVGFVDFASFLLPQNLVQFPS